MKNSTSGIRPREPDTYTRLLAMIPWEYGPNASGALSVAMPMISATKQTLVLSGGIIFREKKYKFYLKFVTFHLRSNFFV